MNDRVKVGLPDDISFEDSVRNALVLENNAYFFKTIIQTQRNQQLYQVEVGKVLYGNGVKVDGYIITPYNIVNERGRFFHCQVAVCVDNEMYSINYNSKYESKEPIPIMQGYIFFIYGKLINRNKVDIETFDLLKWQTDIPLAQLKVKVQWEYFPVIIDGIPVHENEQNTELEHEYFRTVYHGKRFSEYINTEVSNFGRIRINNNIIKQSESKGILYIFDNIGVHTLIGEVFLKKPFYFNSHIHHIDNNGYNNNIANLINVTLEQHASIHLFMWNQYRFENNSLRSFYE